MRTVCPERLHASLQDRADIELVGHRVDVWVRPLNEKDDVRAATCSSLICVSELSSSSVSPSEKYSLLASPLMLRTEAPQSHAAAG